MAYLNLAFNLGLIALALYLAFRAGYHKCRAQMFRRAVEWIEEGKEFTPITHSALDAVLHGKGKK